MVCSTGWLCGCVVMWTLRIAGSEAGRAALLCITTSRGHDACGSSQRTYLLWVYDRSAVGPSLLTWPGRVAVAYAIFISWARVSFPVLAISKGLRRVLPVWIWTLRCYFAGKLCMPTFPSDSPPAPAESGGGIRACCPMNGQDQGSFLVCTQRRRGLLGCSPGGTSCLFSKPVTRPAPTSFLPDVALSSMPCQACT